MCRTNVQRDRAQGRAGGGEDQAELGLVDVDPANVLENVVRAQVQALYRLQELALEDDKVIATRGRRTDRIGRSGRPRITGRRRSMGAHGRRREPAPGGERGRGSVPRSGRALSDPLFVVARGSGPPRGRPVHARTSALGSNSRWFSIPAMAKVISSSARSVRSMCRTPCSPPSARPCTYGRPMTTASAPRASAR
jgi:hypothetical protein